MFRFLLDAPSIEGTVVQRRIAECTQSGFENKTVYQLKNTSSSLSRSNYMYNEAQMAIMEQELAGMINFWGYDKGAADAEVKTDFFDVNPDETSVDFRSHNENSCLSLCGQMNNLI